MLVTRGGGRIPNTADIGLDKTRVALDERGFVRVNEHLQTSEPGCTNPPSRNRFPGAICCSAAIDGVEKKTIESLSA